MRPVDMVQILMIAKDFAEDLQTLAPCQALVQCGHEIRAVCPNRKTGEAIKKARGSSDESNLSTKRSDNLIELDASFEDVDPNDYEALVLPAKSDQDWLLENKSVLTMIQRFFDDNKPVAATMHAREILATAIALAPLGSQSKELAT